MLIAGAIGVWAIASVIPSEKYDYSINANRNLLIPLGDSGVHSPNFESIVTDPNPACKLDINELNRRLLAEGLEPVYPHPAPKPVMQISDGHENQQTENETEPEPAPVEAQPPSALQENILPEGLHEIDRSYSAVNIETPETVKVDISPENHPEQPQIISASYDQCPKPAYPPAAEHKGIEGKVILRVKVGIDGSPLEVKIISSSGNPMLDRAAVNTVTGSWRFKPATQNGISIESWVDVPIVFELGK